MEWMGLNDLREKFLSFFESKGHLRMASANLIPQGDNSLLLINSGMAPLKPFFLGTQTPPRNRVTTCQKCIRTPDIEHVGKTSRHGTYFEMLGNFSFGDYFKTEAIHWAWEFLTEVLQIPREKLWITIFESDDEAEKIWRDEIGIPADRIVRLGKKDNFWEHGSGPCGPCSEIHFDRGEAYGPLESFEQASDNDRIIEVWNLVFSQFDSDGKGTYTEMAHKNIDTGMGLERLAVAMQGVDNLFEVDTVQNIMKKISEIAGVHYHDDEKNDVSLRVITDHIRSTTFMIGDGVTCSNTGRGYVLRRLLRRAARHGRLLGINEPFLYKVCDTVIDENKSAYPELEEKLEYIKKLVRAEEESFAKTIDQGLEFLTKALANVPENGTLSGEEAFRLSDTYGFPIDLTKEIAAEKGISVDEEGFTKCVAEQKKRSRDDYLAKGGSSWDESILSSIRTDSKTVFDGYTADTSTADVLLIYKDNAPADSISEGDEAVIILDRTPFYAESGGQVGDTGVITIGESEFAVTDTQKNANGVYMHFGTVTQGGIAKGDKVTAQIDKVRRSAIMKNHTSVHLLQAALRKVLGDHVHQMGSYVDDTKGRFDFVHHEAMTAEEIAQVERIVNDDILKAIPVTMTEMPIDEAKKLGAMALFGEKYGDIVRVVAAGDVSVEFCGGTHVDNTVKLGMFRIVSENSVAAGVRRIESITCTGVLELLEHYEKLLREVGGITKASTFEEIPAKATANLAQLKAAEKEVASLNSKLANAQTGDIMADAVKVGSVRAAVAQVNNVPKDALRTMGDDVKAKDPDAVVLFVDKAETVTFLCVCGADAVKAGADAGKLVRETAALTGGKGGGRKDSAMAGAGDASKADEAAAAFISIVEKCIG
ncbi:MAG: alanine--tRNA ligase [Oscillospiraceae bacterium]|nr:alanine--tRNA ligase [Oscillospiraceae bacterium]